MGVGVFIGVGRENFVMGRCGTEFFEVALILIGQFCIYVHILCSGMGILVSSLFL